MEHLNSSLLLKRKAERRYIWDNRKIVRKGRGVPKSIFEAGFDANIEPRADVEMVSIVLSPSGKLEIALAPRDQEDKFWGGLLALLGTALRKLDAREDGKLTNAFKRLFVKEFGLEEFPDPVLVTNRLHNTPRETEVALVYYFVSNKKMTHLEYHDPGNLPDNLAKHHYPIIQDAVLTFIGDVKTEAYLQNGIGPRRSDNMVKSVHNLIRMND